MNSLVIVFFTCSIIVSLTVLSYVSKRCNKHLDIHEYCLYLTIMSLLHAIAYTYISKPISPIICLLTFGILLSYVLDLDLWNGFKFTIISFAYGVVVESFLYNICLSVFDINMIHPIINNSYYIALVLSNIIVLIFTNLMTEVEKIMGMWYFGKGTKKQVPVEKK